jgi:hypothetical protein
MCENCGDSFVENITIIDEWIVGQDKYRLVNLGAGPDRLQIFQTYYDRDKLIYKQSWRDERDWYSTAVLTRRVKELKSENACLTEEKDQLIIDKINLIKDIKYWW